MNFELSAPSKTFLLGEYLAMQTGEALIAATGPRFRLQAKVVRDKKPLPFHKDSPAGKLLAGGANFELTFQDPHEGRGGFGRSTAEFLFGVFIRDFRSILLSESSTAWTPQAIMKAYRQIFVDADFQPSGADLLAQFEGGLAKVDAKRSGIQRMEWFPGLSFSVFHTGQKLSTHQHLAELQEIDTSYLQEVFQSASNALGEGSVSGWVESIKEYRQGLRDLDLEAESTTAFLEKLLKVSPVLAAKGCGAMGADVLVCFHKQDDSSVVRSKARDLGLRFVSDSANLDEGFKFQKAAQ